MNAFRLATLTLSLTFLVCAGCAASSVSQNQVSVKVNHPIKAIALAPSGGILADAVGVELSGRGYLIVDTATVSQSLIRLDLSEVEIFTPRSLENFKGQGVDAILSVRATAGYDGRPQSASARINSTHTGQIIAGVTWQNGWGGAALSPADRIMRSDISDAASEIANALVSSFASN